MLQEDQAPVFPVSTAALSRQLKKKVMRRHFQPFIAFHQCLERSKKYSVLTEIPGFYVVFQWHWLHHGLFALDHWGFLVI
jgi:hypothetical protein